MPYFLAYSSKEYADYLVIADTLSLITRIFIGVRDLSFAYNVCVRLFLWRHQCAPLASDGTRAFYWGPRIEETCGFHLRARGHVRKMIAVMYMCVCLYACGIRYLCSSTCTVLRIMSLRVSRSMILTCAPSVPTILRLPYVRVTAKNYENSAYRLYIAQFHSTDADLF